jgi:transposase
MEPREEPSEEWRAGYRAGFEAGVAQTRGELETELALVRDRVGELEVKVVELVARTERPAKTSRNSSLPPSADPPSAPKRESRRPTGKKRGAQKGHPGHHRQMLDPEQVDQVIDHHPHECPTCQMSLSVELPDVLPPIRQQVWELPKVKPIVTEHRQHTVECPNCQAVVKAPDIEMPREGFGPRATALAGVLHGRFRLSHRETQGVLKVVGGLPVSLGGVVGLCQETAEALSEPYAEIAGRVRSEPVVNVDETSWRQAGKRPWIWTMVGKQATLFQVSTRRNSDSLRELLGADYLGTVISDRYSAYKCLSIDQRALGTSRASLTWARGRGSGVSNCSRSSRRSFGSGTDSERARSIERDCSKGSSRLRRECGLFWRRG